MPFAVLRGAPAPGPFAPVVLPDVSPDFSTANSQVADSSADHQYELGLTTAAMSYHTAAIDALRQCTTLAPDHAPAYRKLAELLRLSGEDQAADAAEAAASTCRDVKWEPAADRRTFGQLQKAERKLLEHLKELPEEDAAMRLREHLIANPLDAIAMRWLARLEARAGDLFTARALFRRALDLCPTYIGARREYC
ncbi:MAG: hypothetical protein JO056_11555, partial [Alphaproteobacteria bacterium]|nr:hypothetical protein [Alphaproteobacteria bacterium]